MASRWSGLASPQDQARWRQKIQVSALINRLNAFAKDDPDNATSPRMTRTQAMVALALLRKCLPDMATVEVSGPGGAPISVQVMRFSDGKIIDMAPNPLPSLSEAALGLDPTSSDTTADDEDNQ
jgi:hypothetical protein